MIKVYVVMRGGTHRKLPSQVFFDQDDAIASSAGDSYVVQCELALPDAQNQTNVDGASIQSIVSRACDAKDHERFRGVFFATNGCLACECEKLRADNASLFKSMRSTEDQLIAVANFVGAKCGDGLPAGSGDTLGAAIIRRIQGSNGQQRDIRQR